MVSMVIIMKNELQNLLMINDDFLIIVFVFFFLGIKIGDKIGQSEPFPYFSLNRPCNGLLGFRE